jgi:hypothetical protein|tara:strand:+ start:268 stop:396 length:129 start_codon:yes stop_codon:yes gene_type:complete
MGYRCTQKLTTQGLNTAEIMIEILNEHIDKQSSKEQVLKTAI